MGDPAVSAPETTLPDLQGRRTGQGECGLYLQPKGVSSDSRRPLRGGFGAPARKDTGRVFGVPPVARSA